MQIVNFCNPCNINLSTWSHIQQCLSDPRSVGFVARFAQMRPYTESAVGLGRRWRAFVSQVIPQSVETRVNDAHLHA